MMPRYSFLTKNAVLSLLLGLVILGVVMYILKTSMREGKGAEAE